MAISVVQRTSGIDSNGGAGAVTLAYGSNNTLGNTLIVIALIGNNSNASLTISDSQTNTWVQVFDRNIAADFNGIRAWAVYNCKAGANTVTVNDGFSSTNLHIYEVSGLASSAAFDKSTYQKQSSTTALDSSAAPTTTNANELILGAFFYNTSTTSTWTAGTNFSNLISQPNTNAQSATEERIVSATGAYNATATGSISNSNSLSAVLTFSDTPIVAGAAFIARPNPPVRQAVNRASTY